MTDRSHNYLRVFGPIIVAMATSVLIALTISKSYANEDIEKGEAIAREAEQRDLGWGDSQVQAIMILEDIGGNKRERRLRLSTLEGPDAEQGDKSLVVFDEPRDIKGTALLSYTRILEPDDQWLFLPALKRVKRISSANKSGSFVGSEFAYEDITGQEFEKYSYKWLLNEPCNELECFVVERRPRYANSGYSKLVTWYDTDEYRIMRVDYFDLDGDRLKTLSFDDYRQYKDRFWRPHELTMDSFLTGKSTIMRYENYRFETGLSERDFDQGSLRRTR
jgi:outer membrane lipoprotein-sorting protein